MRSLQRWTTAMCALFVIGLLGHTSAVLMYGKTMSGCPFHHPAKNAQIATNAIPIVDITVPMPATDYGNVQTTSDGTGINVEYAVLRWTNNVGPEIPQTEVAALESNAALKMKYMVTMTTAGVPNMCGVQNTSLALMPATLSTMGTNSTVAMQFAERTEGPRLKAGTSTNVDFPNEPAATSRSSPTGFQAGTNFLRIRGSLPNLT